MAQEVSIFWHRRDLRTNDNTGLYRALKNQKIVLPIFIFDKNILDKLDDKDDQRVTFLHNTITNLQETYKQNGSTLKVFYGEPLEVFKSLANEYQIGSVYTNHDYEPYAKERDYEIRELLNAKGILFYSFKDQCILEKGEVLKDDGKPYTVFSPYMRKWKSVLTDYHLKPYPTEKYFGNLLQTDETSPVPSLAEMGFERSEKPIPNNELQEDIIKKYHLQRDIPSMNGTSRLSVHLRFGTVSIRALAKAGVKLNEKWLNELIWRDFYFMILWHFPHVVNNAFKPQYDNIPWRDDVKSFNKWREGKTGYPIVDAGMRELNATGFMHNRVRMIVASFLTKHLLIDWRWGKAYFARKLLDFELSSNNGGWQWAASSGCDAAPYFRVFNPELQTKKFDPQLKYIKKWVPEFESLKYQQSAIVEHKFARERVLKTFKEALGNKMVKPIV